MATSPIEPQYFDSFDGARIAWRETGEGRPVVLIHGYFSNAATNWIRYGHAAAIAAKGFRVIMPDLRGHGDSAKPHDATAYPPGALVEDNLALIAHLGLTDYDLGGYSLGARTTAGLLLAGATPGKVVFAGMGLGSFTNMGERGGHFRHILTNLGQHKRGSPAWLAEAFLKTTGGDPQALLGVLNTFVDLPEGALEKMDRPTLVVAGEEDDDNGSPPDLAAALPQARYVAVPGGHMSAVVKPELGRAIADFLAG